MSAPPPPCLPPRPIGLTLRASARRSSAFPTYSSPRGVVHRRWAARRDEALRRERAAQAARDLEECTFQPNADLLAHEEGRQTAAAAPRPRPAPPSPLTARAIEAHVARQRGAARERAARRPFADGSRYTGRPTKPQPFVLGARKAPSAAPAAPPRPVPCEVARALLPRDGGYSGGYSGTGGYSGYSGSGGGYGLASSLPPGSAESAPRDVRLAAEAELSGEPGWLKHASRLQLLRDLGGGATQPEDVQTSETAAVRRSVSPLLEALPRGDEEEPPQQEAATRAGPAAKERLGAAGGSLPLPPGFAFEVSRLQFLR